MSSQIVIAEQIDATRSDLEKLKVSDQIVNGTESQTGVVSYADQLYAAVGDLEKMRKVFIEMGETLSKELDIELAKGRKRDFQAIHELEYAIFRNNILIKNPDAIGYLCTYPCGGIGSLDENFVFFVDSINKI